MARIKYTRRSLPLTNEHEKGDNSQNTAVQSDAWPNTSCAEADIGVDKNGVHGLTSIVIEIGASHTEAFIRRDDGQWNTKRWIKGTGASNVSGAEVIPTITAVETNRNMEPASDKQALVKHGFEALKARVQHPERWTLFSHLKSGLMGDVPPAEDLKKVLDQQAKKAQLKGWEIREVALSFFEYVLQEVTRGCQGDIVRIYVNLIDGWANDVAQRMVTYIQELVPWAVVEGVDECFSSLVGCIPHERSPTPTNYIVVDGGHSTMTLGHAVSELGSDFEVRSYTTHGTGAERIDAAAENVLRDHGCHETTITEMLEFINEHFKPTADTAYPPRWNIPENVWTEAISAAEVANTQLDQDRLQIIKQAVTKIMVEDGDKPTEVILTGRALRSATFRDEASRQLNDLGIVIRQDDEVIERTAVVRGLQKIADTPAILEVNTAQLSLWLRSDGDEDDEPSASNSPESGDNNGASKVIRILKAGQSLTGKQTTERNRSGKRTRRPRNAQLPLHYELSHDGDNAPVEIDLSVFGTPTNLTDEEIILGQDEDLFQYSTSDKVTSFGRVSKTLSIQTTGQEQILHVYVFTLVGKFTIKFFTVFAMDGHEIPKLEKVPYCEVIVHDGLSADWQTHDGVKVAFAQVGQISRPEKLAATQGGTLSEEVTVRPPKRPLSSPNQPKGKKTKKST